MNASYTSSDEPSMSNNYIEPSKEFIRQARKVFITIILFIIIYILTACISIALALGSIYLGILTFSMAAVSIWLIFIAVALVGLGILVLYFQFKFLFNQNKIDRSGMIEIQENQHPKLFSFIREITQELEVQFPKRIYLTPDVNAFVFYDSSIWSIVLPIKKNLNIGLGLVNGLNTSEFKAVLAHEFGHFSQKSMKFGSFIYLFNKIIYDMLYQNSNFNLALQRFGNVGSFFSIAAFIVMGIVNVNVWILEKCFSLVNKFYMGLSRQMEYQADAISASISGSQNAIRALRRIEISGLTFDRLLMIYNGWMTEQRQPKNIYNQHKRVIQLFSEDYKLSLDKEGLPLVEGLKDQLLTFNRLEIKNQWASHPSTDHRCTMLELLNIPHTISEDSPWLLFDNPEEVQIAFSQELFKTLSYQNPNEINIEAFEELLTNEINEGNLPQDYNGFYDLQDIPKLDLDEIIKKPYNPLMPLNELLSIESSATTKKLYAAEEDLEVLKQIKFGTFPIKHFDFGGKKYKVKEVEVVLKELKAEIKEIKLTLLDINTDLANMFFYHAKNKNKEIDLKTAYEAFYESKTFMLNNIDLLNRFRKAISVVFQPQFTDVEIKFMNREIQELEPFLKEQLSILIEENKNSSIFTENQINILNDYLNLEEVYLSVTEETFSLKSHFNEEAFNLMMQAQDLMMYGLSQNKMKQLKKLLEFQLRLIEN